MNEGNVKEIYTDGIGKIHYLGGTLRLDLFSFQPSDDEKEKPNPVITKRLIMSPNAFLASYESFVNMIEKLQEAGIIAKSQNNDETSSEEETSVERISPDVNEPEPEPAN